VKSAHERGGQHDLTSDAPNTSEVDVSHFPTASPPPRTALGMLVHERIGDRLTTAEPSVGSLQRSLVSSSLLKAGGELRGRRTGR
jgi:hypothetical protein